MQDYKDTIFYKDEGGNIWEREFYMICPSVGLKLIGSEKKMNIGITGLIYQSLTKIPKEQEENIKAIIRQFEQEKSDCEIKSL